MSRLEETRFRRQPGVYTGSSPRVIVSPRYMTHPTILLRTHGPVHVTECLYCRDAEHVIDFRLTLTSCKGLTQRGPKTVLTVPFPTCADNNIYSTKFENVDAKFLRQPIRLTSTDASCAALIAEETCPTLPWGGLVLYDVQLRTVASARARRLAVLIVYHGQSRQQDSK
jgi:hypothetical protein